jgi:spermidine/putrescine-binding protein
MNLKDKLTFGKYKGKSLTYICYINPYYIMWLLNNIKDIELDKDVRCAATQRCQSLKRSKPMTNANWIKSLSYITDN